MIFSVIPYKRPQFDGRALRIFVLFDSIRSLFNKPKGDDNEKPFQAEFFSVERLEQYAQTLAAEHETVTKKGRAQLLPRL